MPTNTLTDAAVRALKPRERAYKVFDGGRHVPLGQSEGREGLADRLSRCWKAADHEPLTLPRRDAGASRSVILTRVTMAPPCLDA